MVSAGVDPAGKITSIVAGMAAGADSIDDLQVIRAGGMARLFGGVYPPATLGQFLREFTHGPTSQLAAVSRAHLVALAQRTDCLDEIGVRCFVDIDSLLRPVYGKAKQGASFGHTKSASRQVPRRGLSPLATTISTERAAPMVAGIRLRSGKAGSGRGAASMVTEAIKTARAAGATGQILVRGYPGAVPDPDTGDLSPDAEVAYTAFAGTKKTITARLVVRRVKDQAVDQDQALFPVWRYHPFFTDCTESTTDADITHRRHAIIETVSADRIEGPLAHLPSGRFAAKCSWSICAAITHNLLRAAGTLSGPRHGVARGATLRRQFVNVPARLAQPQRRATLHLPAHWPWQAPWTRLWDAAFTTAAAPPASAYPTQRPAGPTGTTVEKLAQAGSITTSPTRSTHSHPTRDQQAIKSTDSG